MTHPRYLNLTLSLQVETYDHNGMGSLSVTLRPSWRFLSGAYGTRWPTRGWRWWRNSREGKGKGLMLSAHA